MEEDKGDKNSLRNSYQIIHFLERKIAQLLIGILDNTQQSSNLTLGGSLLP